jgi:DNA repair protein RecN (Recombination protein N)
MQQLAEQLERSQMDDRERAARLELIAFQLGEIEKVRPTANEDEELTATRQVLANAEHVRRLCEESYDTLYERDAAVLAGLGAVWKRVAELSSFDPQFTLHLDARDSIKAQLEDLARFLRQYADSVDASPGRLQQVEDRLAALERLKRKYGGTLDDVLEKGRVLAAQRDALMHPGAGAADLEQAHEAARRQYLEDADELSTKRRAAAPRFAHQLEGLLAELAMPRARFEIRFNPLPAAREQWSGRGIDQGEFFLSANPGEDVRPLVRIVSGGELSRVMLALKTLSVADAGSKTLVFDEVDAGIGGRVADVVGARLADLGDRFQVLCITHLAQITARAGTHFRIDKTVRRDRTVTSVQRLDASGRIEEVARMIGGASVTESVRTSARELLSVSARRESKGTEDVESAARAKGKQKAKGESESRRRL